jgi:hypothetical protein
MQWWVFIEEAALLKSATNARIGVIPLEIFFSWSLWGAQVNEIKPFGILALFNLKTALITHSCTLGFEECN